MGAGRSQVEPRKDARVFHCSHGSAPCNRDCVYLTAVGDTVNLASRLQDQTKLFACQLVLSAPVAQRAGIDVSTFRHAEIAVRNRAETIGIHMVDDVEALATVAAGT